MGRLNLPGSVYHDCPIEVLVRNAVDFAVSSDTTQPKELQDALDHLGISMLFDNSIDSELDID